MGLLKQCCLSVSRSIESVPGGSVSKLFLCFLLHSFPCHKHPAGVTIGLHAHLLRVPGQAGESKDLGSKEGEAQDLTVALTGFRCDTSHLLNLSSGIGLRCNEMILCVHREEV